MASLIALEFDYEPHVDNSAVPLLFPQYIPYSKLLTQTNARGLIKNTPETPNHYNNGSCRPRQNNLTRYAA